MRYGFVYLLANKAMPGIYKIGMTDRSPLQRVDELSRSTSIPMSFDLVCYAEVDGALEHERALHAEFSHFRVNENREFFSFNAATLEDVIQTFSGIAINFCNCDYGLYLHKAKKAEQQRGKVLSISAAVRTLHENEDTAHGKGLR
ncbi:GIY-YIG nuclease family protein [Chromobacterium rhizoryzae]|uniref:GIY-YIG nuclease family protein n=1 Tax=Chromobacterium rhizoryzae TaxID=1778675 RepID=A0AAD0W8H7_9NEIS|nr:GIY-YIG nuclease family protein [Chromobacterium rhizoryzae]AXT46377.1 GIY-YIG nuclease family protein [Chromobacterium rhizoryzae]